MASLLGPTRPTSSPHHHQNHSRNWRNLRILSNCIFAVWVGLWTLPPTTCDPRAPQLLTWEILNPTGQRVWSIKESHTPGTWWPTLHPDVCQLAIGLDTWDLPEVDEPNKIPLQGPGTGDYPRSYLGDYRGCRDPQRRCFLGNTDFYVCPKDGRNHQQIRKCGGPDSLYCAAWGCETTGEAYWNPSSSWDWITVRRNFTRAGKANCYTSKLSQTTCGSNPLCNPLNISFTNQGKNRNNLPSWLKGRTWGLRYYAPGYDFGLWFTIRLRQEATSVAIGPNKAIRLVPRSSSPIEPP